jgi:hypothetical protein
VPFDRAKTSLAFLEDKFRKAFGLAGTIGATFDAAIIPVYTVGDARDPGVASFRGRHWAWSFGFQVTAPSTANDTYGLTWPVDVLLNGITVVGLGTGAVAGDQVEAFLLAPDDPQIATWGGGNRQAGTWIDQKSLAADRAPILDRALRVSAGMAITNPELRRIATWAASGQSHLPVKIHSPAGGALFFQPSIGAGAIRVSFSVYGQIF